MPDFPKLKNVFAILILHLISKVFTIIYNLTLRFFVAPVIKIIVKYMQLNF